MTEFLATYQLILFVILPAIAILFIIAALILITTFIPAIIVYKTGKKMWYILCIPTAFIIIAEFSCAVCILEQFGVQ